MARTFLVQRVFARESLLAMVALAGLAISTVLSGASTAAFTAATTNDNSTLTTVNFSLTSTNSGSALFSVTDAVPGDCVQKNVTVTTVGTATLSVTLTNGTSGGVVAPLNASTDQALQIRVESCTSATFATANCTGVAGLNGGSSAGVAASTQPTNSQTVKFSSIVGTPQTLQTNQPSGTYYYKVFMKIPSGTVGGGSGSDNDFINKSASVLWTWTSTSAPGSLRNVP
jgi:hypothetical protein